MIAPATVGLSTTELIKQATVTTSVPSDSAAARRGRGGPAATPPGAMGRKKMAERLCVDGAKIDLKGFDCLALKVSVLVLGSFFFFPGFIIFLKEIPFNDS